VPPIAGDGDELDSFGFDSCEDSAEVGADDDAADAPPSESRPPVADPFKMPSLDPALPGGMTVGELLKMREDMAAGPKAAGTTAETAKPAQTQPAKVEQPPGDALERAGIGHDVTAVILQAVPDQPGAARYVPPRPEQAPDRRRLAAALVGVGSVLDRMAYDGTAMSAIDTEAARGLAAGLAADAETVETRIFAQFAAGAVVLQNRLMAAAAKATNDRSAGSAQAALAYTRAASTGFRIVQRTLEAVNVARARRRDRTSIPLFVVARWNGSGSDGGR